MQLEPTENGGAVLREGSWMFSFVKDRNGNLTESAYGYEGSEIDPEFLRRKREKAKSTLLRAGYSIAI